VKRAHTLRFSALEALLKARIAARARARVDSSRLQALAVRSWWRDEYRGFATSIDLLSRLVLEDGRRWGDVAEDVQWEDALAILKPNSATPYHFLTRARGRSKTTDLGAIVLVVMLTQSRPGEQLYALAADRNQGALLVDSIRGFVQRTPGLANVVRVSQYRVVTPGNVEFEVLAADAASAWGLRPAFLVVDEIAWWAETRNAKKLWEAIFTAMHKVAGARLVVLTTSGDTTHFAYQIRERAANSALWRLHEVPGPPPWSDRARLEEERAALTDSSWRRLFVNEWTTGTDRLTNPDDVAACLRDKEPLPPRDRIRYVIGVDLGLVNDPTVAVVAHLESPDDDHDASGVPSVIVDRLQVWPGTHAKPVSLDAVETWLHDTAHHYNRARIVMDSWQGAGMAQRLRGKHLKSPTSRSTLK
jgi:hypothetical protein